MMSETLTLYGYALSGNCHKIRFLADNLNIPYRWIEIDILRGETRTDAFLAMNPWGQVPVVTLPTDVISTSRTPSWFILPRGSHWIPADAYDRAVMMQWLFWEQYSHETAIAVRRFQKIGFKKSDAEIDPSLLVKGDRALDLMERHLSAHRYFGGGEPTLADIALVAYTRLAGEGGFDLGPRPAVRRWVSEIETVLAIAQP